jgi:NADH-quinone oxidoreductase subunit N
VNLVELTALLPIIAAAAIPVVLILAIAARRSSRLILVLTLIGFAVVLATLAPAGRVAPLQVTPLLQIDGLALFFIALTALSGAATALLATSDHGAIPVVEADGVRAGRDVGGTEEGHGAGNEEREELYVLLALAALGAMVLGASRHFAALFLGLELLSLSLFPLIAYRCRQPQSLEAGIKYLVLSGVATGLLLFGMALLYAGLGSLELAAIGQALAAPASSGDIWILGGITLVIAGLAMKLSLVPLHWWTPDVYQGAPAVVTGFLASVAKGGVVVVLVRLLAASGAHQQAPLMAVLAILAVLSMVAGNLLALLQDDVKRILAYSSIAHMGYLLVALLAAGELAREAVSFYLVAYFVSTLGAFGALALKGPGGEGLIAFRGLYRRRPWLTTSFTLMLLSLGGIPVTAGFFGKFYLFAVGVDAALWIPVAVLVGTSLIGLFYYLRIIFSLYTPPANDVPAATVTPAGATALATLTITLVWLGAWPASLIDLIHSAMGGAF